jgi:hypothetical protein
VHALDSSGLKIFQHLTAYEYIAVPAAAMPFYVNVHYETWLLTITSLSHFLLLHTAQLGYIPTYIIGTLSLPGFLYLFYAAIKKGKAEEEDDEDFY